jgi:hypothetical protein
MMRFQEDAIGLQIIRNTRAIRGSGGVVRLSSSGLMATNALGCKKSEAEKWRSEFLALTG